jgi:hypothetical protein
LLRHLPYLEDLRVVSSSDLGYKSPDFFRGLTSLRTIAVIGGGEILTLPEGLGDLTTLTELVISQRNGIKALPGTIQKLTSLQTLKCISIVSLPKWLGDLASLVKLEIIDSQGMEALPDAIRQLTRLQALTVWNCKSIVWLPESLGDLTSLMELEIGYCRRIKTLPDNHKTTHPPGDSKSDRLQKHRFAARDIGRPRLAHKN